jgi:hypothetical protein
MKLYVGITVILFLVDFFAYYKEKDVLWAVLSFFFCLWGISIIIGVSYGT